MAASPKRLDRDSREQSHHSGQFGDTDKAAEPQANSQMLGIGACGGGTEDLDEPREREFHSQKYRQDDSCNVHH